jgi:hypothetical protein
VCITMSISTRFVVLVTISGFLIFKLATDPISIENSLYAEIRQVTDFGLVADFGHGNLESK